MEELTQVENRISDSLNSLQAARTGIRGADKRLLKEADIHAKLAIAEALGGILQVLAQKEESDA